MTITLIVATAISLGMVALWQCFKRQQEAMLQPIPIAATPPHLQVCRK
jgi:hypothetical protein